MNNFYGKGIVKGLKVSLQRFIETYLDDLRWIGRRYKTSKGIEHRSSKDATGIFTIQYPEERIPVPEEFRFLPFLIYDEKPDGSRKIRCTSCGICAKVCPTQCIWIIRSSDPVTHRPIPDPAQFYVEADVCMNCGLCAEFCPFDSIKMDHDYELASFNRGYLDIEKLLKPSQYYEKIRPANAARENAARAAKQAASSAVHHQE